MQSWDTAWYQDGESLWTVANKVAYAAYATVEEVFEKVAGVGGHLREAWLFPSTSHAIGVCRHLDLPLSAAKGQLFASVGGIPTLEERSSWQLGIRFCPACLDGFVHRTAFQNRSTQTCPLHGCRLSELCPHCMSPIDPLCKAAWTCNDCGTPLVEPGRGWPQKYRAGPTVNISDALPVVAWPMREEVRWNPHVNRRQAVHWAFEEHAALCSVMLGRHRACVDHENNAKVSTRSPVHFNCPMGAAAAFTAQQFGFSAQCILGEWVPSRPLLGVGLRNLEALLGQTQERDQPDRTRELVRAWFVEALAAFVHAGRRGDNAAFWTPSTDPRPALKHLNPVEKLRSLALAADVLCSFRDASGDFDTTPRSLSVHAEWLKFRLKP